MSHDLKTFIYSISIIQDIKISYEALEDIFPRVALRKATYNGTESAEERITSKCCETR